MCERLHALWHDEEAVTTVEYALILALVAIVAIAAWQGLGLQVKTNANSATVAMGGTAAS
jgi:Flp pilus assembly pilin Flp